MHKAVNISLKPLCNARLSNLCGALDGNIECVARAYDVVITRRGGDFCLRGKAAQDAARALQKLYAQADDSLDLVDVQLGIGEQAALPPKRHRFAAKTQAQSLLIDTIIKKSVTFCVGPAGTGKTHGALVAALLLLHEQTHSRLVLSRPAVEAGGERIGFLPGDMEQKVNPYLRPLYDILYDLLGKREVEKRISDGQIEVIPLSFMRGVTIDNAVIVLDEAQNTTPSQMMMTLTRLGVNGRIAITGDESQNDLPAGCVSGLTDAINRLSAIPEIAVCRFSESDIVRHPLVREVLRAYADLSTNTNNFVKRKMNKE